MNHFDIDQYTTKTGGHVMTDVSDDNGAALESGPYEFRYQWCSIPWVEFEDSYFEVFEGLTKVGEGEFTTCNMVDSGDYSAREAFARWLDEYSKAR